MCGTADYGSTVYAEFKDIVGYMGPLDIFRQIVISEDESKNVVRYVYTILHYFVIYYVDGYLVFGDSYDYNTEVTVRETYQMTGHTVTNWSTDDVEVVDGKFILGTSDVAFNAVSTANPYDVIYKVDGETVFTDTFGYGTEVTVRDMFQKTGYTVTRWSTDDVEVIDGKFILGASDVTLSATSTVNTYVYVVIYVDDDTRLIADLVIGTADYGTTVYAFIETIAGYTAPSEIPYIVISEDESKNIVRCVYVKIQYDVVYKVDGETVFTDTFGYGTEVTVRDMFQKTGYTVTEWSTDDAEVLDGKFVLGASDVTFSAVSAVNKYSYTVEYVDGEGNAIADPLSGTADYGSTVDAEIKDIVGYTAPSKTVMVFVSEDESKNVVTYVYTIIVYTITFDDGTVQTDVKYTVKASSVDEPPITKKKGYTGVWEEYALDLTDKTVKAVYTAESYHVEFISDGAVFFAYGLEYGKEITLPSGTPSKDADVRYIYTFSGWDGYTEDMTVDGDITFVAVFFRTAAVAEDGSDLAVNVDEDNAVFSSDTISDVLSKAESDPSVTMTVSVGYGVVVFDNGSLRSLGSSEATLELYVLDPDDMTQTVRDVVGDNVAYSISFGPNKAFGGIVTVTVPYVLAEGKDPDNLVVYYVAEDGTVEEIPCTYSEGYVTFSTDHFSVYAVMYGESYDVLAETVLLALITAMIVMPAAVFFSWRRAVGRSV
ncbi:MucBP domain-containing protein [Methanomethylophilus alvi]|uniref:MucBP domain-containing protein n=1 Tax=Methanomethylophilus alvi TaxID=1291540 RepID=UPI0037DC4079